jgi:hypothetical protein
MSKYFPCPICHGKGGEIDVVCDDGTGPYDECYYCDDKGMIEVGGSIHRRIKAEHIALEILDFMKPEKEEWTFAELQDLGNKALNLVLTPTSEGKVDK